MEGLEQVNYYEVFLTIQFLTIQLFKFRNKFSWFHLETPRSKLCIKLEAVNNIHDHGYGNKKNPRNI